MSATYEITAENLRALSYRELFAGDDYPHQFKVQRGGVALSLAGAKVWFTVKEASLKADANAKLQLTSASSTQIEITDAVNGIFVVKFTGAATADLEGTWLYDIQIKLASGTIITAARGVIEFLPNLTRATS